MAHWDDERDKRRVKEMRECGPLAIEHKDLIDKYEEKGDDTHWYAFIDEINKIADGLIWERNKTAQIP